MQGLKSLRSKMAMKRSRQDFKAPKAASRRKERLKRKVHQQRKFH